MIKYKFDILERLKVAGYTTYKIRKEKLFSESTLQKFRKGETTITGENINSLCEALNIQPGDIIEYVPDDKEKWRRGVPLASFSFVISAFAF